MIRAGRLDGDLYDEVQDDPLATRQALLVIGLSSIASGVGTVGEGGPAWIILGTIASLFSWTLWAMISWVLGTIASRSSVKSIRLVVVLRTLGFSACPGMLRILGIIPFLYGFAHFVAQAWMLLAMVVAIRQILPLNSTGAAVGLALIGWVIQVLILILLFLLAL